MKVQRETRLRFGAATNAYTLRTFLTGIPNEARITVSASPAMDARERGQATITATWDDELDLGEDA